MAWKTAKEIVLSEKQERILSENAIGTHTPLHKKIRSQIILNASKGWSNTEIGKNMCLDHKTVRKWRNRYSDSLEELKVIEAETPRKLRSEIQKVLSDTQRKGAAPKFKDEQVAAIIALSCECPSRFNLPFSNWTPELLQIEAIKLGIVESISVRQIRRFLKRKRFKSSPEPVLAEP